MFTGLIETTGRILEINRRNDYRILRINSDIDTSELTIGESVACDGACLTVVKIDHDSFWVEASTETQRRTRLGGYQTGSVVNLERALKVGDRMGGHIVSGHVDDVGKLTRIQKTGDSVELTIGFDPRFDPLVIEKGSIAVDGVSLTVNSVESGALTVNLIPHTLSATNLLKLKPHNSVNLEFDMIGKYILKSGRLPKSEGLTKEKLFESGW